MKGEKRRAKRKNEYALIVTTKMLCKAVIFWLVFFICSDKILGGFSSSGHLLTKRPPLTSIFDKWVSQMCVETRQPIYWISIVDNVSVNPRVEQTQIPAKGLSKKNSSFTKQLFPSTTQHVPPSVWAQSGLKVKGDTEVIVSSRTLPQQRKPLPFDLKAHLHARPN